MPTIIVGSLSEPMKCEPVDSNSKAECCNEQHASDSDWSSSAHSTRELSAEDLSSLTSGSTSPRLSNASVLVKMSSLQASFAEKTAEEMKQIVDWYSANKAEDRFTKVRQSQSLPDNPLACIDDEDEDIINDSNADSTPQRSNRKASNPSSPGDQIHTPMPKLSLFGATENGPSDCLPGLASSPATFDSPQSIESPRTPSSSRAAENQYKEVSHFLESTQSMALIVSEYERSASTSDRELKPGMESRRKHRPLHILPDEYNLRPDTLSPRRSSKCLAFKKKSMRSWIWRCAVSFWPALIVLGGARIYYLRAVSSSLLDASIDVHMNMDSAETRVATKGNETVGSMGANTAKTSCADVWTAYPSSLEDIFSSSTNCRSDGSAENEAGPATTADGRIGTSKNPQ